MHRPRSRFGSSDSWVIKGWGRQNLPWDVKRSQFLGHRTPVVGAIRPSAREKRHLPGTSMQGSPITFIVAFIVVLALIGVAAWLVRRFAANRLGANTQRGRMPRLAVIDAAAVDGRRRLVLVRRDNVEHLLMIGGPTDIVVEPNIVRAAPGRDQIPQRPSAPSRRALAPDAGYQRLGRRSAAARTARSSRAANARAAAAARAPLFCRRGAPARARSGRTPQRSASAGFTPEPIAPRPEREPRPEPTAAAHCRAASRR